MEIEQKDDTPPPPPPIDSDTTTPHAPSPPPPVKCECVAKLLGQIAALMRKKATYSNEDSGFVMCPPLLERKWSKMFVEFILENIHCSKAAKCTAHSDDMLWYVPLMRVASSAYIGSGNSHLQVFRRQSRNKPVAGASHINWEETVCLNVILQQLDYFVTCASCTKSGTNLQILRKNCQRVFPSPSRRRMDVKGECEEITYPKIYFAVDNFDQVFSDVIVTEGECICVELLARDRYRDTEAVIFLGSIRYDILKKMYDSRGSGTWNWAQKIMSSNKRRHEFVKMRGPRGKGFAEMAIARVASCGFDTPMSESGFDTRSFEDFGDQSRRMSDTNVFQRLWFGSSAGGAGGASTSRRTAMTPNPQPSSTPTPLPGQRGRRWTSDADNIQQQQEDDVRSVDGDNISTMGSTMNTSVWSMRGIGQALQFLQNKTESIPLNAYLTYITLPWVSILEGCTESPVLEDKLWADSAGFYTRARAGHAPQFGI